jgi:hypothetical protein
LNFSNTDGIDTWIWYLNLRAYEEGDHVGVLGLLRLEVLHRHHPVVAREVLQEEGLYLVRELKYLLKIS